MNNDLTGLLNLAYEIEGLLLLHINRGDEASPEMIALLMSKSAQLQSGIAALDSVVDNTPVITTTSTSTVATPAIGPETYDDLEAIATDAESEEREDADAVPTVNDTAAADSQPTLDERLARERAADISKAFTLNDRFRFRRGLFRDSDSEFKETLEVIGSMADMSEAEDYFFNDLCWDPSDPEVKDFMAIVAKHF